MTNNKILDIVLISGFYLSTLLSLTGCKTASATNPVAPSLATPITILTDISTGITAVQTVLADYNADGVLTSADYTKIEADLTQAQTYTSSALDLLKAGDSADAKTAITNLGSELITLSNDGDIGLKSTDARAAFDTSIVAVEALLATVNL